jgi:hypothetical protein
MSSRIPRVGKGGGQKDDANCEHTHGQYHFLCFQCNPKENNASLLNQISAS